MIRFTLALVARSGRWVAPAVVYLVWLVLVLANPGPALTNGANMFFGVVVFAAWFAVVTGNVDDDPHRDLCAAVAGSAETGSTMLITIPVELRLRRFPLPRAAARTGGSTAVLGAVAGDVCQRSQGNSPAPLSKLATEILIAVATAL